jgi:hypothetical protein
VADFLEDAADTLAERDGAVDPEILRGGFDPVVFPETVLHLGEALVGEVVLDEEGARVAGDEPAAVMDRQAFILERGDDPAHPAGGADGFELEGGLGLDVGADDAVALFPFFGEDRGLERRTW